MIRDPYLIQRMKFREPKEGPTIDGILRMDYMGSAEFEFGALPASLKEMCRDLESLSIHMLNDVVNVDGKRLCLICKESDVEEYSKFIPKLIERKLRLKEASYLDQEHTGKDFAGRPLSEYNRTDAWWDIDNHIMFTYGKDNARKILNAISALRDKKKAAGERGWYR